MLTAHYAPGALLLSEAASPDGRAAKLLLAARNPALPAGAALHTGLASNVPGLRELVTELDQLIPGGAARMWRVGEEGLGESGGMWHPPASCQG